MYCSNLAYGQNTMDAGFNKPWVGVKNTMDRGQNTMGRRFDIPWVSGSKYHE